MEIIHVVFTRNTKAKNNPIADIVNQLATEQLKLGIKTTIWEISRKPSDRFQNKAYPLKHFSHHLFLWNTMKEIRQHLAAAGSGQRGGCARRGTRRGARRKQAATGRGSDQ